MQLKGLVWVFVGVVASSLKQLPVAKAPRFNSHKWAQTAPVITVTWLVAVHTSNLQSLAQQRLEPVRATVIFHGRESGGGRYRVGAWGSIRLRCVSVYKAWLIWQNHANSLTNYTRYSDARQTAQILSSDVVGAYIHSVIQCRRNYYVKLFGSY